MVSSGSQVLSIFLFLQPQHMAFICRAASWSNMAAGFRSSLLPRPRQGVNGKRRRCQLCAFPSRRFSGKSVHCISLATPTYKGIFQSKICNWIHFLRRKEEKHTNTLTGQLSVGHRRSFRASLCEVFSVQVCMLPADPKGINTLSSYMQSLPASRVCRQGNELVYLNYRWASERFINLLWDTQQSKKVGNQFWMLEVDIKGKSVKAQFEILSLVSPVHQGLQDVDMIKSQAPVYPQQRNSHSNSHLILCT